MDRNAPKDTSIPSARELRLLEQLRSNPGLMNHVEEIAAMAFESEDLLGTADAAELKIVELCRGVGKAGLQGWAKAANEGCERSFGQLRPEGAHRQGKKNSAG